MPLEMQLHLKESHRLFYAGLTFLFWLFSTEWTYSCAVCFSANDESRGAYLFTTGLLSVMPLLSLHRLFFGLSTVAGNWIQLNQNPINNQLRQTNECFRPVWITRSVSLQLSILHPSCHRVCGGGRRFHLRPNLAGYCHCHPSHSHPNHWR